MKTILTLLLALAIGCSSGPLEEVHQPSDPFVLMTDEEAEEFFVTGWNELKNDERDQVCDMWHTEPSIELYAVFWSDSGTTYDQMVDFFSVVCVQSR